MASKQRRAIVFAPGWGGLPPKKWNPLLKRFSEGFDVLSVTYPRSGFGSLRDNSRAVWWQIRDIIPKYDHVTYIGHSMGGLLPWLNDGLRENMDAFITLGTPFKGAPLSKFGAWFSESAWEMQPKDPENGWNDVLYEVQVGAFPNPVPGMIVTAKYDFIVPDGKIFEKSQRLRFVEVPTTHMGLIFSQRTYQEIWAWLTYDIFKEVGHENGQGYIADLK